jgi:hypothetical protein
MRSRCHPAGAGPARAWVGSDKVGVHPMTSSQGSWCARPGRWPPPRPHSCSGLERGVVVELALSLAAVCGALRLGDGPAQRRGDLVGLDHRAPLTLGVSQLRDLSRPMTTARSPLDRDSATCSASRRQTLTRKKLVSPSRQPSPSRTRAVTARRKLATRLPLGVCLSSGSSVRLPVQGDVGVGHGCPPRGSGCCSHVGRGGGPAGWPVLLPGWWSAGAGGGGVPAWSATVLASCLLVGLGSSPAPGDRVSPGRLDDDRVKGRRRRSRRDARNAAQRVPQRP